MERLKLTIANVAEPKPVGDKGAVKLSFKAKTPDGKELQYFTFTKRLFDMIKPEAAIEGDVDISQREVEGNTYIDRKLMEIYIDGKPTGQAKRGWQPADDSPEKRASIEAQKAAEIFGEWVANKVIPLDHPLAQAVIKWGYLKLGVITPLSPEPTKPSASPPPEPVGTAQASEAVKVDGIEMDWLRESLNKLSWTGVGKWLKNKYPNATGVKVSEIVKSLTVEQRQEFAKEVESRLEL